MDSLQQRFAKQMEQIDVLLNNIGKTADESDVLRFFCIETFFREKNVCVCVFCETCCWMCRDMLHCVTYFFRESVWLERIRFEDWFLRRFRTASSERERERKRSWENKCCRYILLFWSHIFLSWYKGNMCFDRSIEIEIRAYRWDREKKERRSFVFKFSKSTTLSLYWDFLFLHSYTLWNFQHIHTLLHTYTWTQHRS